MTPIWRDYGERHAGVLGEADDIHFVRSGVDTTAECLICWAPYFDSIMDGIGPGPHGWTSLALEYHVNSPWEEGAWELSDIPAALEQLGGADTTLIARAPWGTMALAVLNDLVAFLEAAVAAGQRVTMSAC